MKLKDNKGMTLIEIIVVLLMSSLLMAVIGTMILNSFDYFNRTSVADAAKQAGDDIASIMHDKLIFATKVEIRTDEPAVPGYSYFSLNEKGQLQYNGKDLFNDDYYDHHKLKITARIFKSNRFDLNIELIDTKNDIEYSTGTTLELINIDQKDTEDTSNGGSGTVLENITYGGKKIYFYSDTKDIENGNISDLPETSDPEYEPDGTVADERLCRDETITKPGEEGNNKGPWQSGVRYYKGDFVEYDGKIYRVVVDAYIDSATDQEPSKAWNYKQIESTYAENSQYLLGDIVYYEKKYYQVIIQYTTQKPDKVNGGWSKGYNSVSDLIKDTNITPSYNSCNVKSDYVCTGTIADKIFDKTASNYKGEYKTIIEFGQYQTAMTGVIKKGDFVLYNKYQKKNGSGLNVDQWMEGEWSWYMALTENALGYIPGKVNDNYWQYIGPKDKVGKGYISEYVYYSSYATIAYYTRNEPNHMFAKTGDIVYDPNSKLYYGAIGIGNAEFTAYSPLEQNGRYWKVLTSSDIENAKKSCEVKLKDYKE